PPSPTAPSTPATIARSFASRWRRRRRSQSNELLAERDRGTHRRAGIAWDMDGLFSVCCRIMLRSLPRPFAHRLADFALGFFFLLILTLVVFLLAAGDGELELGAAVLEVHAQGDEGEAALRGLAGKLGDLAPVQEKLARPLGPVVELMPHGVFG